MSSEELISLGVVVADDNEGDEKDRDDATERVSTVWRDEEEGCG